MKKHPIKARFCAWRKCQNPEFVPLSDKASHCCPEHRQLNNKERRQNRDRIFLEQEKTARNNYHRMRIYPEGTVVTVTELTNIEIDFTFVAVLSDHKGDYMQFGNILLRAKDEVGHTYQIEKMK
jgi:hypothetical protein